MYPERVHASSEGSRQNLLGGNSKPDQDPKAHKAGNHLDRTGVRLQNFGLWKMA